MTLAALADQLDRFGDTLTAELIPKAGPMLRRTVVDTAARDNRRRMMGATLDGTVRAHDDGIAVAPSPPGPWTLAESGSRKKQWWEPARPGPRSRRLRIGGDVRVRVLHGPIRGKATWSKATDAMTERWFALAHATAHDVWGSVDGT